MKYIGVPRPRYLLIPFIIVPGIFVALLVTAVTLGSVRGMAAWCDLMTWAHYD